MNISSCPTCPDEPLLELAITLTIASLVFIGLLVSFYIIRRTAPKKEVESARNNGLSHSCFGQVESSPPTCTSTPHFPKR